ncbi:MAG: hypothetical protein ACRC5Q_01520 [Culicoidibacterales bacterium]
MWDEVEEIEIEEQFTKKAWYIRTAIWGAAVIVPAALIVNMTAPTIKTLAAERVYAQTVDAHEFVHEFAAITKHVLPQGTVKLIMYLDLPNTWTMSQVKINGVKYNLVAGHDSYLIELTAPTQLGHWDVTLETILVFDGAIFHDVPINQVTVIDVETHIPHFEEVHPEKPKVQQETGDTFDAQVDGDSQIAQKAKADYKFKVSEGEKIKAVEKYALTDEKNLLKKVMRLSKVKAELLPEHGKVVAVFIQETLYPATLENDGKLKVYGLPASKQTFEIQYFVYEDGYLAPTKQVTI